jgi:hypothetical protein
MHVKKRVGGVVGGAEEFDDQTSRMVRRWRSWNR